MKKSLADLVRLRARHFCEYCGLSQDESVIPFEIDHIIAQKHRGPTSEENLALACYYCNSFKGTDIATLDPDSKELTRLFNPRTDTWPDHFHAKQEYVVGRTAIGRSTVFLLSVNNQEALQLRRAVLARQALE